MVVGRRTKRIGRFGPPITQARIAVAIELPNSQEPANRSSGREQTNVFFGNCQTVAMNPTLSFGRTIAKMIDGMSMMPSPIHTGNISID